MKLQFYGAAQNVTGSKHLIVTNGFRLLLDCGMHQGRRREADKLNRQPSIDAKTIDAIILSHAHIDHSGLLPVLVKNGFAGKIYCTGATADILEYLLLDSAKIQEQDYAYLSRRFKRGQKPLEPLYTDKDVQKTLSLLEAIKYFSLTKKWTQINENIRFKFYDAGHILGSAITSIEIKEKGEIKILAFTGDLGQKGAPILKDPEVVTEPVETLIMESTYGDRIHEREEGVAKKLIKVVNEAVVNKSKILVPAFSLGRTQEIIYTLHKLTDEKKIPRIPIYVDSPLSNRITKVFSGHRHDFDKETWEYFLNKSDAPMTFRNLYYINKVEDSKKLNTLEGPFMVISASGMAEGGRIVHHLMNNIENPNNVILITGYQAVHTLGRKIHAGVSPVRIHGRNFQVKAKVITMNEFSAHADQDGLLTYLASIHGLKNLFLVHGEKEQAESFKTIVESIYPKLKVQVPALGDSFEV